MTYLVKWREPRNIPSVFEDFDRLFDLNSPVFGRDALASDWSVAGELSEDEDNIYANLELPGVDKKDVKITLEDGILTISGEKKQEEKEQKKNVYRTERSYGQFKRRFRLPTEVQSDQVKAEYKDGVLNIVLPKSEEVKPKEITIDVK